MRLELVGVRKDFGKTHVLKGIDLTIASGERVALVGPNGSGKSTFLRAVLGLVACEGRVTIDGKSPYADRIALVQHLAYVPQVAPQLSAPVGELVGLAVTTRKLDEAAVVALAARLDLPLNELRTRPFRNLSGGMKQKLLIALAMAARPKLLVMDEPTASLDAASRARFFELFAELGEDVTALLCSHRLEELQQLSRRVVALEEGKVAFDGSREEYLRSVEAASRGAVRVVVGGAP